MNRPMAMIGFSLFFTLIAVGLLGYNVAFWLFLALSAVFVILMIIRRGNAPKKAVAILLSMMLACSIFCIYTSLIYNRVVAYADSMQTIGVEIVGIEGESNGNYYYVSRVVDSQHRSLVGARVRLSSGAPLDAQVGDRLTTTTVLKLAGASNAITHRNLRSDEIFLSTHILADYTVEKNPDISVRRLFYNVRVAISQLIEANLSEDTAAVVNSILLGETSALDYKANMSFRNIGISHIFSVSGLHVSLISTAIFSVLLMTVGRRKISYIITLLLMWCFVAVTGFSYSSIRAGIMLSVYYVGQLIARKGDSLNSLGLAAVVICVMNPYSATNISVLYSFFATLGIVIISSTDFAQRMIDRKSKIVKMAAESLLLSVSAMIFTLPVQIVLCEKATVISPLANLLIFMVIAPLMWCVFAAVLLSLFTSILSSLLFAVGGLIARYLMWISSLLSSIPFATVDASRGFVKVIVFIVACVFLIILYLRLGRRAVIIAVPSCVMIVVSGILCYNIFMKPVGRVTVIDSGAATSVVVTCGRSAVVVGCGGSENTAGGISYALRKAAIDEIRLLVLPSKGNSDAYNISGLVEMIDINEAVLGEGYGLLQSLGVDNCRVVSSGRVVADQFTVECLYNEEQRATLVRFDRFSVLVVSHLSDGSLVSGEWLNADVVVSVGELCEGSNARINVLCTSQAEQRQDAVVACKGEGNVMIELYDNGRISCEGGV